MKHPMQQIIWASDKCIRFRQNDIVRFLLDNGGWDMNSLAMMNFSRDDWNQFSQLIGYSVSGFGELSYAYPKVVKEADVIADKMSRKKKKAKK